MEIIIYNNESGTPMVARIMRYEDPLLLVVIDLSHIFILLFYLLIHYY